MHGAIVGQVPESGAGGEADRHRYRDEAQTDGHVGGLDPPTDAELAEDVADVDAYRPLADEEPPGDVPVRAALHDEAQHLDLPRAEVERIAGHDRSEERRVGKEC